jgi:hypothetical protein
VGIAHQKHSAIGNEMVGNAHPTLTQKSSLEEHLNFGQFLFPARFTDLK